MLTAQDATKIKENAEMSNHGSRYFLIINNLRTMHSDIQPVKQKAKLQKSIPGSRIRRNSFRIRVSPQRSLSNDQVNSL